MSPLTLSHRLAALLLSLALLLAGRQANAQEAAGPVIQDQPAPDYTFGGGPVTFRLSASAAAEVADVTLYVRTPDEPRTFVGKARFARGQRAEAVYELQPERRALPPFAPVTYWWEVTDGAGRTVTTERQTFLYGDNRFTWQTLTEGGLTVAWYEGDRAFGRALLDVAAAGLQRANRDLAAPLPETVTVYVYARPEDAAEALRPAGRTWADGRAAPLFGAVVVILPPGDVDTPTRMAREIPHELTHIVVAQKAGERWPAVPAWLNEGLAVRNEASPDPDAPALLAAAREAGDVLPLAELCGTFPPDAARAQLAYAQSASVVRFIQERYGVLSLRRLLEAYADGLDCDHGVQRGLGLSLAELESEWLRQSVGAGAAALPAGPLTPWLILGIMVLLAPFFLLGFILRPPRPATRVL